MADSRAATGASVDAALAAEGILYDGATDGFVDTMNHAQIKNLLRICDAAGITLKMTSGVLQINQAAGIALTDTSAA